MTRTTTIAIALLSAGLWACPPASESTTGTSAGAVDEQAATPEADEKASPSAYADPPVPADYADEAAEQIDEENYESTLEELERELGE